jgi:hypothetical protein
MARLDALSMTKNPPQKAGFSSREGAFVALEKRELFTRHCTFFTHRR